MKKKTQISTSTLMKQQQRSESRRATLQAVMIGGIVGLLLLAVLLFVVTRDSETNAATGAPSATSEPANIQLTAEPGVLPFPAEPNEQFNAEAVEMGRCVLEFVNANGGPLAGRPGSVYETEQALMAAAVQSCRS